MKGPTFPLPPNGWYLETSSTSKRDGGGEQKEGESMSEIERSAGHLSAAAVYLAAGRPREEWAEQRVQYECQLHVAQLFSLNVIGAQQSLDFSGCVL